MMFESSESPFSSRRFVPADRSLPQPDVPSPAFRASPCAIVLPGNRAVGFLRAGGGWHTHVREELMVTSREPTVSNLNALTNMPETLPGISAPDARFVRSAGQRSSNRRVGGPVATLALGVMAACSGGGGGPSGTGGATTAHPILERTEYGRLVDVYGLDGTSITLFRRDVLIGPSIQDQRATGEATPDSQIQYDFIGSDPDTLQPRLLLPRDTSSDAFKTLFETLDDSVREVSPMAFGEAGGSAFSVVPRNAAIRMTFTAPLGVGDDFFVERDSLGLVSGLRNTEAVQLLKIVGDPAQPNAFVPIPARVSVQGRTLVIDPVLLGSEGLQYQTSNNAAGLPESPNQSGANIRVAIALDGPLAIPGLREGPAALTGLNNSQRVAIIRDFRSGNANDTSAEITRGFVRDPLPLRIVGELSMYLERVDNVNTSTQEITVYKGGIVHEIDLGDVIRIVSATSGLVGFGEVVVDPEDDFGQPGVQHVRVRIRRINGLEAFDPRNLPGYPSAISDREPWLVANAPRAVCVAEFTAGGNVVNGVVTGDDPRYFLRFTPSPRPNLDGSIPASSEFVSPFAAAVVRFTKPVDMTTVKSADTFFFAMRDLVTTESIADFIASRPNADGGLGMEPAAFKIAKYRTPFLVGARVADEDGSQTALRLQPTSGFYLDDTMRNPPAGADYRYFLHLIANSPTEGGIRDLAGNALDLQGDTADRDNAVVIPFTIDTRMSGNLPFFDDNITVSLVRRYADRDEDENPSYYIASEVPAPGTSKAASVALEDIFGGFVYQDGKIVARPTTRSRVVADDNQQPVGIQGTLLAWCPERLTNNEPQTASNSATSLVNQGIQNPMNPYGCRLQMVWREVDLSLSRTDPFDFNLDIEQMYWAPYTGTILSFDEFDSTTLKLGHAEFRPVPCLGAFSALPSFPDSGLRTASFEKNFVWNPNPAGTGVESQPAAVVAYEGKSMPIDPSRVVYEPQGENRFLPLPTFQKPYFVYRDETLVEQGGNSGEGNDTANGTTGYGPYIVSPYANGLGRRWTDAVIGGAPTLRFTNGFWNDAPNVLLTSTSLETRTGGLLGNIALPMIAEFQTACDRPDQPLGAGYIAFGTNGWQVAVTVQSSSIPNFRVLSAGRGPLPTQPAPLCRAPGDSAWAIPSGGFTYPAGGGTPAGDNTLYWIMMDVLKRQSVITAGFVDLNNPHRVPEGFGDPRLGPFYLQNGQNTRPANVRPQFGYEFDPPPQAIAAGTSVVAQFRAASNVDPTPWYWDKWYRLAVSPAFGPQGGLSDAAAAVPGALWSAGERDDLKPTAANFALDPFKACDAHIRKWDNRPIPGTSTARDWWAYFYNRTVTSYVNEPNELTASTFTSKYNRPNEPFTQRDIRYVNWRFVTSNNTDAIPPVSPSIETFSLSYRFELIP